MIAATSRQFARAGGVLLLASALLISAEIIARKLFGAGWNIATELSGYALAIGSALAFADTMIARAHIRVDVLYGRFPRRARMLLDLLSAASLALFALMLAWRIAEVVAESWWLDAHENTTLATPLVIPQGLWWLAVLWFTFVACWITLRTAAAVARGDAAAVRALAGPPGIEEELDEAMEDARRRQAGRAGR
ncbi:MAG: TRAP transporter small permease subunit [Acetobacteraceae bacterium]|nr:TRAP transporter small permease subunit [Acetobacteraceae bacterium]